MIKIKDLKVGSHFQLEGLDVDGNTVYANCTLRTYNGMNKFSYNLSKLINLFFIKLLSSFLVYKS